MLGLKQNQSLDFSSISGNLRETLWAAAAEFLEIPANAVSAGFRFPPVSMPAEHFCPFSAYRAAFPAILGGL